MLEFTYEDEMLTFWSMHVEDVKLLFCICSSGSCELSTGDHLLGFLLGKMLFVNVNIKCRPMGIICKLDF